ncbi:hypothetical protein B0H14DRAFT_2643367 [Mycena olivaceomarginata]|nr:hypothetical protein B0H14DRAFT_2643367 [Mycena olivaceomarginata]
MPLTILSLVEDYAERFGDFVPDAAIEPYIMRRNWATERLDVVDGGRGQWLSIQHPGPIEAYMTAASHFHSTFGRPAGELTEACQLLVTHKAFLDECRGDVEKEHRLLGQKEFLLTFVNPFPRTIRSALFWMPPSDSGWWRSGASAPLSPTFSKPEVTFRFINRGWEQPGSVRCRKAYCRYRRLAARLAELQQHAENSFRSSFGFELRKPKSPKSPYRDESGCLLVWLLCEPRPSFPGPYPAHTRPRCASALKHNQTSRRVGASGAQSGSKRLFRFYHNDHTATSTTVTSLMNDISRRRELARIGRKSIDDQVEAHLQRSLYKEREGSVYCNVRWIWGRGDWSCESATQEILWIAAFECAEPKRVERLLHLELAKLGARLQPRPCPGCGTNHREYFEYSAADGFEGVLEIIEASWRSWGFRLAEAANGVRTLQAPRASQQAPDKRLTSARQEPAYGIWMGWILRWLTRSTSTNRRNRGGRSYDVKKKKIEWGAHRAEMNEWAAPRLNCGAAHQWGVKRVGGGPQLGNKMGGAALALTNNVGRPTV